MLETSAVDLQAAAETQDTTHGALVALEAVARLFEALRRSGVRYCHWKSNLRLDHGLLGRTDLDLLVDRTHSQVFRQILHEYDIKPALAAPGKHYPAIENYLGFDPASGKLFHLHVHYQLVLGEQFVKNYRLPLEARFLTSVQARHGVNIPVPELEIIVLAIRALLKYRDRDVIKDILSIRSPGLPDHILAEIRYLLAQTSMERIAQTLAEIADIVPADVVLGFLQTVVDAPRAGATLYRLRTRARRALRPYQRNDRLRAMLTYAQELWRRRSWPRSSPARNMALANGGMTLALVGADGAGKSTLCRMLARWLAWKLDVHVYYLGSKQPSRQSELLHFLFRMARRGHHTICRVWGEGRIPSRWAAGLRDGLLCAHLLSIGLDRYRRYQAGKEHALAGSLVIFDRYPLESLDARMGHQFMDGPRIPLVVSSLGAITRALAAAEQSLYRRIRPPDCLCVLEVSPEVSLQRKPDHQRAVVEAKSRAIDELIALTGLDGGNVRVIRIDADMPFEAVASQIKARLWDEL